MQGTRAGVGHATCVCSLHRTLCDISAGENELPRPTMLTNPSSPGPIGSRIRPRWRLRPAWMGGRGGARAASHRSLGAHSAARNKASQLTHLAAWPMGMRLAPSHSCHTTRRAREPQTGQTGPTGQTGQARNPCCIREKPVIPLRHRQGACAFGSREPALN